MNVITKSGNLASYFRVTTQLVGNTAKSTTPIVPAHETKTPNTLRAVSSGLNNALSAQTAITGGKLPSQHFVKTHSQPIFHVIHSNIAVDFGYLKSAFVT